MAKSAEEKSPVAVDTPQLENWVGAFLWDVQKYTNDYIKFADTKAAFTIAASTGIIGGLFSSKIFDSMFCLQTSSWSKLQWLAVLALINLIFAVAFSVSAIRPRLWSNAKAGLIFWDSIKLQGSAHKYLEALRKSSCVDRDEALSQQAFVLASIAQRKYRLVSLSMIFGSIGGVCAGLMILLRHALIR